MLSRAYVALNSPDDVVKFAQVVGDHTFVNERGISVACLHFSMWILTCLPHHSWWHDSFIKPFLAFIPLSFHFSDVTVQRVCFLSLIVYPEDVMPEC